MIVANGFFPCLPGIRALLLNADFIVCCDGAADKLIDSMPEIKPDFIIGDGDSISQFNPYINLLLKDKDQECNDLTKAVNFVCKKSPQEIIIIGATGKREDHALANIALMAHYAKLHNNITMLSDYGIFSVYKHNKALSLVTVPNQPISFFGVNQGTLISCSELKWPLKNYNLSNWYQGSLNIATSHVANIVASDDVLIYRAFTTI